MNTEVNIKLSKQDFEFIVDNALNGLWNHCEDRLTEKHLGDIEKEHLIQCRDKCKRLMSEINKQM